MRALTRLLAIVALLGTCEFGSRLANGQDPSTPMDRPNIVIVFTDDQGYGDLSCFGSTSIRTPRIDSLAAEGTKFTSFYAQVVCGPSRSALLTGRYPNRSLGWSMPGSEVTVAELLKQSGYATGCIGKWDVSNRAAIAERMPLAQGFDYYWGPLGANDNGSVTIHENNDQIETTRNMAGLTRRYTDKAIQFIQQQKDGPFFLYLAHTMVHSVIDASPEFIGKSSAGLYGDTVEELDHHTGRLLDEIDRLGLRDNTLVIFTTDNGAWNNMQENLRKRHSGQVAWGSSGPLREGKGSTYEGGLRVPCLMRWPGKIPAGRVSDALLATIDFLPTFGHLAGFEVPRDRYIDGCDQTELLLGKSDQGARSDYFYWCMNELHGVRQGDWKLILADRRYHYGYVKDKGSNDFELYNLREDIGEQHNLAGEHPDIVQQLMLHATSVPQPDVVPNNTIALPNQEAQAASRIGELLIGDWLEHGLANAGRQKIRATFEKGIAQRVIPGGSAIIISRGEVVFRESFGVCDVESQRPFDVDTPCRIASVTKPHTATLLILLAEQGKLDLDIPVDAYLPEFRSIAMANGRTATRAPTIRECLSHTAGFPGNSSQKTAAPPSDPNLTLATMVREVAEGGLINEPGTKYDYSRMGYQVAGRVAEVVTGRMYQDLLRRNLIEPLGMQVASFTPPESAIAKLATQYSRTRDGSFVRRREADLLPPINPGGSLISSLDDVARLMLLHRNHGKVGDRQIVSAEALSEMYVAQPATPGTGYGLGFNIMKKRADGSAARIRHTGASGTLAMLDFDQDLIVVVFTQVDQTQINNWRNQLLAAIADAFK